jgi:hypothetical protein
LINDENDKINLGSSVGKDESQELRQKWMEQNMPEPEHMDMDKFLNK